MVTMLSSSVQKVEAFEDGSKAVIATKALRDQYHCSPCDVVFFNVDEKNADQVLTTAKEFQSICGKDRLAIGLFVFRSLEGYALGKELTRKIGGHTATYCKPIMQRRLLDSLQNMDMLNSAKMDETNPQAELSLGQFRVKEVEKMQETTDVSLAHLPFEKIPKTRLKSIIPRPPRKRSASSEIKNPTHSEPSNKSRTRVVSKSKCILCVEDNPINLKVLQHQLKALGYQSICATNGQEAVNILQRELGASIDSAEVLNQQNRVSLILMDCAMPIMSGYAASKAIRAMAPPQSEIPIIALTASAIEGTRDKCLKNGMNDYLTKPLKIPQLKDMLLRWLGDS
ncbi:hypothetical protein G9A89_007251 [Geosiphon pyriformis]|nr:hypothetical protein G9A89_007251 [Geosiphon pyriformis]